MVAAISSVYGIVDKALDFINREDVDSLIKKGKLGFETKGSITKLVAETIIAPRIVISESLKTNEHIDKIVNLTSDILISFVSRGFVLLTELKGFSPETAFDVLKTDSKKVKLAGMESDISKTNNLAKQMRSSKGLTLGNGKISATFRIAGVEDDNNKKDYSVIGLYAKEVDLSVEVKNKNGDTRTIKIPLIVKAHVSFNSLLQIKEQLIDKSFEKGAKERVLEAEIGLIPWLNVLIPFDMWEAYKQKKINDHEQLLAYAESQSKTGASKILTSGTFGFGTYLGGLIISFDDLEDIETNVLRGKISNSEKRKDLIFENSKTSLLNIVDKDYNKLTIYTKDIDGQSIFDLKSLKGKTGGNDINDIFKDILMNRRFN